MRVVLFFNGRAQSFVFLFGNGSLISDPCSVSRTVGNSLFAAVCEFGVYEGDVGVYEGDVGAYLGDVGDDGAYAGDDGA